MIDIRRLIFNSTNLLALFFIVGAAGGLNACSDATPPVAGPATITVPADSPVSIPYTVVRVMHHDSTAFTQGFEINSGYIYEGTGLYGASSLRRLDRESGRVLHDTPLDARYFGEGITIWKDTVVQLTWQGRIGFLYDKETFESRGSFTYLTEGWGLTQDATHLIMSDGTANLYYLNPNTFAIERVIEVREQGRPVEMLNELEYVNGSIYANIWQTSRIIRIDPATGRVTGTIDLGPVIQQESPPEVLNGIAWDPSAKRLLITGKYWSHIYELEGEF